jgi:NAD/NADP transhydrogenase beta subunit
MSASLATVAYIAATILFILSLGGLSNPETSRRGNLYGIIGMILAVLATVFGPRVTPAGYAWIVGAMAVGAAIGLWAARTVRMTQMPELVAIMHSLVGVAAVTVGFANYIDPAATAQFTGAEKTIHEVELYLGILIGAVTFSGSVIAFGKLAGRISGKPVLLPGRHVLNLAALLVVIGFGYGFLAAPEGTNPGHDRARRHDRGLAALRRPHGDGDRRRRHAGRGLDAQQLLRLGGGGDRLHAQQRPAHRHRRAGRLERRHPLLHHVPRHEPQVPGGDRGRLRHRRRRRAGRRRRAAGGRGEPHHGDRDRRPAARREERHHRAGLRHGGGPRPSTRCTRSPGSCATRASTCASASIRSPAACPAT